MEKVFRAEGRKAGVGRWRRADSARGEGGAESVAGLAGGREPDPLPFERDFGRAAQGGAPETGHVVDGAGDRCDGLLPELVERTAGGAAGEFGFVIGGFAGRRAEARAPISASAHWRGAGRSWRRCTAPEIARPSCRGAASAWSALARNPAISGSRMRRVFWAWPWLTAGRLFAWARIFGPSLATVIWPTCRTPQRADRSRFCFKAWVRSGAFLR